MHRGKQYSFTVVAREEIPLPEYYLLIEPGVNHFNAFIEDLPGFISMLREANAVVQKVYTLGADVGVACGDDLHLIELEKPRSSP